MLSVFLDQCVIFDVPWKQAKNTFNLITANQLFKAHKASTLCQL